MGERMIRTLVVEDDAVAAEAYAAYLGRIDGFELVGTARTIAAAYSAVRSHLDSVPVDLVLLDLNLPDGHGLELARRLRSTGVVVDIIAITAVREVEVVRSALAVGIVHYLIKPFSFTAFRERLDAYRQYRDLLESSGASTTQAELDSLLASLRPRGQLALPKGLSAVTLGIVVSWVRASEVAVSSVETAEALHLSRVTARRYLEHLLDDGRLVRSARYGTPGRPELEYRWA